MRKEILKSVKRVVIKIGSQVLTDCEGALDMAVIGRICADIAVLKGMAGSLSMFPAEDNQITGNKDQNPSNNRQVDVRF